MSVAQNTAFMASAATYSRSVNSTMKNRVARLSELREPVADGFDAAINSGYFAASRLIALSTRPVSVELEFFSFACSALYWESASACLPESSRMFA